MSGSEDEAAPVTKAEFGRLLTAIVGIQDQMQSKRESWPRTGRPQMSGFWKKFQTWKRSFIQEKGTWKAVLFQRRSQQKIAAALDCLIATPPAVERAREALKEGEDLIGVVHIVSCWSKKPHLQDDAMAIFELCFQHSMKLEMDWIPRGLNTRADFLSRIVDYDDWGVDPCIFIHAFFVH